MCIKEIGLHAQNLVTILDSIIGIIFLSLHDHIMALTLFDFQTDSSDCCYNLLSCLCANFYEASSD